MKDLKEENEKKKIENEKKRKPKKSNLHDRLLEIQRVQT